MSTSRQRLLERLQSLDLAQWTPTFWLVKRRAARREAEYSVVRVDMDARLGSRFASYVAQQLQAPRFHLDDYGYANADTEDVLLTLDAQSTDFPKVQEAIDRGFDNPLAREYADLLNSWAYVVQFARQGRSFFAWRKINAMTDPRKVKSRKATFFANHQLMDVEDDAVFLIDPRFDFYVCEDVVFIANKREFESSMNFRKGMQEQGGELLREFADMAFLSDVAPIREYVGNNLNHLRKLASIRKAGYYRQPDYVSRLMRVCREEGWGLEIAGGRIVVQADSVELLLKLLNNDRLRSPINGELFDSAVKTTVGKKKRPAA